MTEWIERCLADPAEQMPDEVRTHAEQCSPCKARIQTVQLLAGTDSRVDTPPDLAGRIVGRIGDRRTKPRRDTMRLIGRAAGIAAVAIVALLIGVQTGLVNGNDAPATSHENDHAITVRLTLDAPHAEQVVVVGDWNGWRGEPMARKSADGHWEVTIRIEPGKEYLYQFVINDEEWIPDPTAPFTVDDGFGGRNSVLDA